MSGDRWRPIEGHKGFAMGPRVLISNQCTVMISETRCEEKALYRAQLSGQPDTHRLALCAAHAELVRRRLPVERIWSAR